MPLLPVNEIFYLCQVWQFNFCIHSAKSTKSTMFMWNESQGHKGVNDVVSCLNNYITKVLSAEVDSLYLFSDGCIGQNKNMKVVQYPITLVASGRLKCITHYFPVKCHSFLPCDTSFTRIEKIKRKKEKVETPREWEDIVKNEANFNVETFKNTNNT
ncbi:hypothetical protein ANN_10841 [Periplaneta americana]|uniref:DUF7869 domain-containing protein n=1 Tax=Periplaneta americana TaxID=6978 RepID=A0ABQ8T543_PERAM|nr:hypothetical protein ANN_10841 [Periplaneta americana]